MMENRIGKKTVLVNKVKTSKLLNKTRYSILTNTRTKNLVVTVDEAQCKLTLEMFVKTNFKQSRIVNIGDSCWKSFEKYFLEIERVIIKDLGAKYNSRTLKELSQALHVHKVNREINYVGKHIKYDLIDNKIVCDGAKVWDMEWINDLPDLDLEKKLDYVETMFKMNAIMKLERKGTNG